MMGFLFARQIRVFDYPRFAEPLRDRVRDRAGELASAAGVTIEPWCAMRGSCAPTSSRCRPIIASTPIITTAS
jgi:hypothetical protein